MDLFQYYTVAKAIIICYCLKRNCHVFQDKTLIFLNRILNDVCKICCLFWQPGEVDVPHLSSLCTNDCKSIGHITSFILLSFSHQHDHSQSMFSFVSTAVDENVDIRTVTVQKVSLVLCAGEKNRHSFELEWHEYWFPALFSEIMAVYSMTYTIFIFW